MEPLARSAWVEVSAAVSAAAPPAEVVPECQPQPPASAIAPAWRHLRHVYAAPKQPAVGQLGIAFAPQTVVVDKGGRLAAGRSRGVKGRLRARDLPDLLLSLCEDD